jgi:uncharacterized protein YbjQ (UPF0145 family)
MKPSTENYNRFVALIVSPLGERMVSHMIITTTSHVEDKKVTSYEGIVFGEVITGINVFKDLGAGIRNIVGGRSKSYEDELTIARENALAEMESRANAIGANAIIGMKMDYEVLGADNGMLMVTCSGTAVKLTDESEYLG